MRTIVIGNTLLFIPEGWMYWHTALLRFERRADESIWCQPRQIDGPWRCVSPCLMPSKQKGAVA